MLRVGAAMIALWFSTTACAGDSEATVEVPFDFLQNQIVLRTWLDGNGPYSFVLDTGTHGATIDIGLARRLRLPLGSVRREGTGAGSGRARVLEAICTNLRVGDLTIPTMTATALDLSKVSRAMGRRVDGALGSGLLQSRITQIDYFLRRIRFYHNSPIAPPDAPHRISFPLQFHNRSTLPVLEDCFINGEKIPVTLDTGSSFGLILFPQAVRRLGLSDLARRGNPLEAAGYRGKVTFTKGWVQSVVLKTIDLGAIEVEYVESGFGEQEDPRRRGGNLGNAVLQDFVVTLDYANGAVVLETTGQ